MRRRIGLALILAGLARIVMAEEPAAVPGSAAYQYFPATYANVSRTHTGQWRPTLGYPTVILTVDIRVGGGKSASLYVSTSGTMTGQPSNGTHGATLLQESGLEAITSSGVYIVRGLSAWTKIRIEATNGATVSVGAVFTNADVPITRTWTGTQITGGTVALSGSMTGVQINGIGAGVELPARLAAGATYYVISKPADSVTSMNSSAAGVGFTVTLTAGAAGLFHYIAYVEVVKYVATAIVASATPLSLATTNWRGNNPILMRNVGAVADAEVILYQPPAPLRATAAATATTINLPATTGVIWSVTVYYYTAP